MRLENGVLTQFTHTRVSFSAESFHLHLDVYNCRCSSLAPTLSRACIICHHLVIGSSDICASVYARFIFGRPSPSAPFRS